MVQFLALIKNQAGNFQLRKEKNVIDCYFPNYVDISYDLNLTLFFEIQFS